MRQVLSVKVYSMWFKRRSYYGNIVMRKIGENSGREKVGL
jgi:hypothetical protein